MSLAANAGSPDDPIGFNKSNKVRFWMQGDANIVNVVRSAIPGTSLLVEVIASDELHSRCFILVRGTIESQSDIDALKPESVLQMSCAPETVRSKPVPNLN